MNTAELRERVIRSLRKQGFRIRKSELLPPATLDKHAVRGLHATSVRHSVENARQGLSRHEPLLLRSIACGHEVVPERILPELVEVKPHSWEELLFRYARLHWSIPISAGYGRRLRYVVMDRSNDKLIGIFGLADPVINLRARDAFVDWSSADRKKRLRHVMDAFVIGAVPPYANLLCGKLMAMLATSNEVRLAFRRKYQSSSSLINNRYFDGRLALITTTSALGRSSVYNRLSMNGRPIFRSVGYTEGSGDFHFSNGLYGSLSEYAAKFCTPTAKHESWGTGFRNKREVVKKCLMRLDLPWTWIYHGVRREVFVAELAGNSSAFLRGEHSRLRWFGHSSADLFEFFRERWLLPRSRRDPSYRDWDARVWTLWD